MTELDGLLDGMVRVLERACEDGLNLLGLLGSSLLGDGSSLSSGLVGFGLSSSFGGSSRSLGGRGGFRDNGRSSLSDGSRRLGRGDGRLGFVGHFDEMYTEVREDE
jgi:hypothetical protein